MTYLGIGTIQRLYLNIREPWRFWSQHPWKWIRVNQGDWKSMGHAAARFWSRLNRQRCGCVLTKIGMDIRKAGRRCLWSRDRVTSKVFERLWLIFGAKNLLIGHLITSSQFRKPCYGRQDCDSNKGTGLIFC